MGEYAEAALDYFISRQMEPSKKQRRRDRQRARKSMRECTFCGKFPLFFHEERPHKWILAEWNDENRPVRHVCKLKRRFNAYHKS